MRALVLLPVLLLAACGFKPSNVVTMAATDTPFTVNSKNPYSPLADNIERVLSSSGVPLAEAGQTGYTITIADETIETKPFSLDKFAQVREYVSRYRVEYSLTDAAGAILIDKQAVELRREFTYDINTSAGSPAEQELLQREMQQEMIRAILRRTNIVLISRPL
jgi:LPS-assembly lipoprotein